MFKLVINWWVISYPSTRTQHNPNLFAHAQKTWDTHTTRQARQKGAHELFRDVCQERKAVNALWGVDEVRVENYAFEVRGEDEDAGTGDRTPGQEDEDAESEDEERAAE
ncbi:hypothetical protein C0995_005131 [Termitomyces sp. Mi166|nr:hypothetical protein C0995_005131 [Termitomyces sp. Mi166\